MIRDGENGFLATSDDEWVEKLGRLAQDASLRRTIGLAGRQEAERRYSTDVNAPLLLDVLRKASARR
jgi:glycosyltransferase involved in cell wall biosynthesis